MLLGSPGPAPLALAGTGASFGFKRGLPFLFGIIAGLLVAMVGAVTGLAALFSLYPTSKLIVQIVGAGYMLYVAYKIASAPPLNSQDTQFNAAPTLLDGFVLNLLNPKAYAAFLAIFSQFLLPIEPPYLAFIATGTICLLVGAVVDVVWLGLGGLITPLFKRERTARLLRICFAMLMLVAVAWALIR